MYRILYTRLIRCFLLGAFTLARLDAQMEGPSAKRAALFTSEMQAATDAFQKHDPQRYRDALAELCRDFPSNSRALRNLAAAEGEIGHRELALDLLRRYAAMGGTLNLQNAAWNKVRDVAGQVQQLAANSGPVSHGRRVFRLPDADLIAEDLGYDPTGKRFIVSSVRRRKVLICTAHGRCTDVVRSSLDFPLGAMLAVRVDEQRQILWATTAGLTAAAGYQAAEDGRSALLKFDLPTKKFLKRYEVSDRSKHGMGDMTVASNGDAFVSDGTSGDVFIVRHNDDRLDSLVPAGTFVSPQTPTLNSDETLLYVPDYSMGIAVVHLADHRVEWLQTSAPMALEGIDGLYLTGDSLIAVQNGTQPERIVKFHLKSASEVDRFEILEANWHGLGDPTHGVLVGDQFYFIVNSGWDRVEDDGMFKPGAPAEIWRLRLR
ncbi:MAG: hypothetical protein LAP21_19150 [Acidobacteriia bacterium]|nr:hypothetical protein [Terriglobia bacterium]